MSVVTLGQHRSRLKFQLPLRPVSSPDIALIVSTYQKPDHLRRVLTSIAIQDGVQGRFELVVTDDGSTDQTLDLVTQFGREVSFPVRSTTHLHEAFQLARCRNEGVMASSAPYLLFLDGDCILPPDHVYQHLKHRQPSQAMGGYCARLDRATSDRICEDAVRSREYLKWVPQKEHRVLLKRHVKSKLYRMIRHPSKPKLAGGNIGIWRSDYERINGYDENFEGWGGEDDDLRMRLGKVGVHVDSILRWTHTCHLWHPAEPSQPRSVSQGENFAYLNQSGRLTRPRFGLVKRSLADIDIRVVGKPSNATVADAFVQGRFPFAETHPDPAAPEVEILFHPGQGRFSGQADCNVLVQLARRPPATRLVRQSHIIVSDVPRPVAAAADARHFALADFELALDSIT